jgi:hypothetical protein
MLGAKKTGRSSTAIPASTAKGSLRYSGSSGSKPSSTGQAGAAVTIARPHAASGAS